MLFSANGEIYVIGVWIIVFLINDLQNKDWYHEKVCGN